VFVGVLFLARLCFIRQHAALRRIYKVGVALIFSALATVASSAEISEKWRIRNDFARAVQLTEKQQYALTIDGANQVLGPFLFGFQAMMIFVALLSLASLIRIAWPIFPSAETYKKN
jgi:hypothetical protein